MRRLSLSLWYFTFTSTTLAVLLLERTSNSQMYFLSNFLQEIKLFYKQFIWYFHERPIESAIFSKQLKNDYLLPIILNPIILLKTLYTDSNISNSQEKMITNLSIFTTNH